MKPNDTFIDSACIRLGSEAASDQRIAPEDVPSAWEAAEDSIFLASALGHVEAVQNILRDAPSLAKQKGGPRDWDPLTYLCYSHFLRSPLAESDFIATAEMLLQAGADPNTGFFQEQHSPEPIFESVLFAAAGIAHHEALTRLLLKHGADPNDGETPYHVPEGYENGAFEAVFQSGKLNESSIATLLLRKIDFHDGRAIKWLLEQGVDPNLQGMWGKTALQSAIVRGNHRSIVELLLQHGAEPGLPGNDGNAHTVAATYGRGDVIQSFAEGGFTPHLEAKEQILSTCAIGDRHRTKELASQYPDSVQAIKARGGFFLSEFAGNGNTEGIQLLLGLGCEINSSHQLGDPYFDITLDSTPLHVAAWRARHETVSFLLENGADIHKVDSKRRTPLHLAVEASVNSYWTELRSEQSVASLIEAGATPEGVRFPCGYEKIDTLLAPLV